MNLVLAAKLPLFYDAVFLFVSKPLRFHPQKMTKAPSMNTITLIKNLFMFPFSFIFLQNLQVIKTLFLGTTASSESFIFLPERKL